MSSEDLLRQESHFAFGKNWLDYAEKIDEGKISQAMEDLRRLSGSPGFKGKSFLDIGCGSGLHALSAVRLGATRVLGVDIDPDSVAAASRTLTRFEPNASAEFKVASVFDMLPEEYGLFDIVYSWGVLHHTGDMKRAIECAAGLVKPEGEFLVALYEKTRFCGVWHFIKRWYSRAGVRSQKRAMNTYIFVRRLAHRVRGKDIDAYIRDYGKIRGMDFHNDVHDWLGGYPYESISPDECRELMIDLGFAAQREFIQPKNRVFRGLMGAACDEYAFRRCAELQ